MKSDYEIDHLNNSMVISQRYLIMDGDDDNN